MEQTPFDPSSAPPRTSPPLPPQSQPQPTPPYFVTPAPVPSPLSPARKRSRGPVLLALCGLVAVAGIVGAVVYSRHAARERETTRLQELRAKLKTVVLADNALVLEIIDTSATANITYAEWFKRADTNKEKRDELIRRVRATEAGPYTRDATNFVQLMQLENEYVRAEEARSRAQLEVSGKEEVFQGALKTSDTATSAAKKAHDAFMAAPYGSDYSERAVSEIARSRSENASENVTSSLEDLTKARDSLQTKTSSATSAIDQWLDAEKRLYPFAFAPPRDAANLLRVKKRELGGDQKAETTQVNTQGNTSVASPTSNSNSENADSPSEEPEATPTPSRPTRVHSLQELEGERFSETRMRTLTSEDVANYSDDDLRYAINEMFARYGLTFKDSDLQGNFDGKSWYTPNEDWTQNQIKRAFNTTETQNLRVLVNERSSRRSQDDSTDDSGGIE